MTTLGLTKNEEALIQQGEALKAKRKKLEDATVKDAAALAALEKEENELAVALDKRQKKEAGYEGMKEENEQMKNAYESNSQQLLTMALLLPQVSGVI